MAVLIEHHAGAFPVWVSPIQVQLAPVSSKHVEGAREIFAELKLAESVWLPMKPMKLWATKFAKSLVKIPYIVVVGDKELAGEEWMIWVRGQKDQIKMSKADFINKVKKEISERNG